MTLDFRFLPYPRHYTYGWHTVIAFGPDFWAWTCHCGRTTENSLADWVSTREEAEQQAQACTHGR